MAATESDLTRPYSKPVDLPHVAPFTRLQVPAGEEVLWYGYNPTFHRFLDYGLVLTHTAIYVCRRSWWLVTHWNRTSLDDVIEVGLIGNSGRPGMQIKHTTGTIRFHTPLIPTKTKWISTEACLRRRLPRFAQQNQLARAEV